MINKICFYVCLLCIILGTILGLAMVWTNIDPNVAWRCGVTLALFFVSGLIAVGTFSFFKERLKEDGK